MRPSPRRPHYALHPSVGLSVRPSRIPTVNLKMEYSTMFKLSGNVSHVRSNWPSNFRSTWGQRSGSLGWKCETRLKLRPWWPHSMLHVSSNTMQQRKCAVFEITGRQCSSGSIAACRLLNVSTHHCADVLFKANTRKEDRITGRTCLKLSSPTIRLQTTMKTITMQLAKCSKILNSAKV